MGPGFLEDLHRKFPGIYEDVWKSIAELEGMSLPCVFFSDYTFDGLQHPRFGKHSNEEPCGCHGLRGPEVPWGCSRHMRWGNRCFGGRQHGVRHSLWCTQGP